MLSQGLNFLGMMLLISPYITGIKMSINQHYKSRYMEIINNAICAVNAVMHVGLSTQAIYINSISISQQITLRGIAHRREFGT